MKHISYESKKNFSGVSMTILNLTLKQLRSIVESINIDAYNSMSKIKVQNL